MRSVSLMFLSAIVLLAVCKTQLLSQDEQTQTTPQECAKDISSDTGVPVFFPRSSERGDLIWGLSTRSVDYPDSVPVILWIDNPSNKSGYVGTCSGIGQFWGTGIDVFDSTGHRVPMRSELQQNKDSNIQQLMTCGRNIQIEIPAHTCKHTTFSEHALDFFTDLNGEWDFKPGRYFIVPAEKTGTQQVGKPKIVLEINIEKKTLNTYFDKAIQIKTLEAK